MRERSSSGTLQKWAPTRSALVKCTRLPLNQDFFPTGGILTFPTTFPFLETSVPTLDWQPGGLTPDPWACHSVTTTQGLSACSSTPWRAARSPRGAGLKRPSRGRPDEKEGSEAWHHQPSAPKGRCPLCFIGSCLYGTPPRRGEAIEAGEISWDQGCFQAQNSQSRLQVGCVEKSSPACA